MKYILTTLAAILCTLFITYVPKVSTSEPTPMPVIDLTEAQNQRIEDLNPKQQQRIERRAARQAAMEQFIDSIVLARSYRFIPSTFNVEPAGSPQIINNVLSELDVYSDYIDVHLPFFRGIMPPYKLIILNSIAYPTGYTAVQTDNGWTITFTTWLYSANEYTFTLDIYSKSGSAQLTISSTLYSSNSYSGSIVAMY